MKKNSTNYETPYVEICDLDVEGVLCSSTLDGDNEDYGGVPGDDYTIF